MKTLIHLYGAAGSGTSTLGRLLANRLDLRFMDTDDYFWMPTDPPFTQKRERSKMLSLLQRDIDESDGAVLSGALCGWGDALIEQFTLAVRVVTPTCVRLERLKSREEARFGERIHPRGDMHAAHIAFLAWAAQYDEGGLDMRSKAEHDRWENTLPCKRITVFGEKPLEENINLLLRLCEKEF